MTTSTAYRPLTFAPHEGPYRTATYAQLSQRQSFPSGHWDKVAVPPHLASQVLHLLAEVYDWPNHYMVPDDCLACLLDEPAKPMAFERFLVGLREELRVILDPRQAIALRDKPGQLVDLLREVLKQWPARLDAQGRIDDDVSCSECGYNLRTVSLTSICPECGTSVSHMLKGNLLRGGDSAWLGTLRKGLAEVQTGLACIALGVLTIVVWFLVPIMLHGFPGQSVRVWLGTGAILAGSMGLLGWWFLVGGTWRITVVQRDQAWQPCFGRPIARFGFLLNLGLLPLVWAGWPGPVAAVSLLAFLLMLTGNLLVLARIAAGLARRIPERILVLDANSIAKRIKIAAVLIALIWLLIAVLKPPRGLSGWTTLIAVSCFVTAPAILWLAGLMNSLRRVFSRCAKYLD